MDEEGMAEISAWYVRFADAEARGRSPLYEGLARAVAGDRKTLGFLSTLPDMKRQPNLLFAAVRHLFGTPTGWTEFRQALLAHPDAVRSLMLERSTQTNEPEGAPTAPRPSAAAAAAGPPRGRDVRGALPHARLL